MKKLLTFSMAMLILFQSLRGGIVYLSLKLNQDEIAANYCVAKDITMCYGSCYIEKEVKKTEQESQKSPSKNTVEKAEYLFINQLQCVELNLKTDGVETIESASIPPYLLKSTESVYLKLLQPPQNLTV